MPRAKERTIMFDSTDTLSAVSGDGSVREAVVETPAPTFYIGDTPIVRGRYPSCVTKITLRASRHPSRRHCLLLDVIKNIRRVYH